MSSRKSSIKQKFFENPTINPTTGKKITIDGPTFNALVEEYGYPPKARKLSSSTRSPRASSSTRATFSTRSPRASTRTSSSPRTSTSTRASTSKTLASPSKSLRRSSKGAPDYDDHSSMRARIVPSLNDSEIPQQPPIGSPRLSSPRGAIVEMSIPRQSELISIQEAKALKNSGKSSISRQTIQSPSRNRSLQSPPNSPTHGLSYPSVVSKPSPDSIPKNLSVRDLIRNGETFKVVRRETMSGIIFTLDLLKTRLTDLDGIELIPNIQSVNTLSLLLNNFDDLDLHQLNYMPYLRTINISLNRIEADPAKLSSLKSRLLARNPPVTLNSGMRLDAQLGANREKFLTNAANDGIYLTSNWR